MKKTRSKSDKTKVKAGAAPAGTAGTRVQTGAGAPRAEQDEQSGIFEKAMALFHAGKFAQARSLFEKATLGPSREKAHVARVHARICEQRVEVSPPALAGPEDRYNYAIALINRRELQAAEKHLQEALRLAPNADHIHYALALARGLRGDIQQAYESLRRAIELEPRNRVHARNDPDFAEFARQPLIASLLYQDREQRA